MKTIITNSAKQTSALGKNLGKSCRGGEILALSGNLGAGKTCFTQGLAKGLGIKRIINSPTFVIMKVYNVKKNGIKKFCHIDAYRLKSADDLIAIGANEYLNRADTVTIIEWAEKIKKLLPKNTTKISLKHLKDNKREIKY
jgi:tRNA threonylcarbamoyladenosine biosynthesis protein TsaE